MSLVYILKMKYFEYRDDRQSNNDKNNIIQDEMKIMKKIHQCVVNNQNYAEDIYRSIEEEDDYENCYVYVDVKKILNNLGIRDIKLLYLYLANIDFVAKKEYELADIFEIVDENKVAVDKKDIKNSNIRRYDVRINVFVFNMLHRQMKGNWFDFITKSPLKVFGLAVIIPMLGDIAKDFIIFYLGG